jgi:sulfhydrogenase subunit alpha
VEMSQEQATLTAEHLVRAYDPCISCATHFLKLKIESRG